eukprot:s321_g7.t1
MGGSCSVLSTAECRRCINADAAAVPVVNARLLDAARLGQLEFPSVPVNRIFVSLYAMNDRLDGLIGRPAMEQMVNVSDYVPPQINEKNLWLLGVLLAVFGTLDRRERESSIMFSVGLALQVALNPLCDLAGYALAPASVIAPVTGMDIVWNTVLFRQINEVQWTAEYVEMVLWQNRTMLYLWNVVVQMRFEKGSPIRGFSLGATAGTLAGNMWCTKITAVLLEQCMSGHCDAWGHWVSWICLFGAVFFATSNLYYISRGMQQHEALFMVTVYMGANITTNSLSAIVVLGEMDDAPWWKLAGYTFCILMMMVGMALLTSGEKDLEARDLEVRAPCGVLAEGPISSTHTSSVQLRTIRCNEGI